MLSNSSLHRHVRLMLSAAVAALGAGIAASPASAQFACDLNGAPGPDIPSGTDTLWCGNLDGFQNTSGQTAVGSSIFIFGADSTAVGSNSATDEVGATAIGSWAVAASSVGHLMLPAPAPTQTAVGYHALAIGPGTVAIGDQAAVGVPEDIGGALQFTPLSYGTAVGSQALVTGGMGTGVGALVFVGANNGTAFGAQTQVYAEGGTALGANAIANAEDATVVGMQAFTNGVGGVAIGAQSASTGDGAIAIGGDSDGDGIAADADGAGSIAIGDEAQAEAGSVAIGAGSVATVANTVSVGAAGAERRIVNVAAGTAGTDAVNVSQLTAATAGISADVTALEAAQSSMALDIDTLFDLRSRDRRDMKQGVAAAMSMAQAPMPSGPGRVSYAVNGAAFRGEYAVGASLNYRLNTEAPMAVSVSASFAGHKSNGFRLGVAGEF
jgi:autotransporter adhesin